ncbi:hypothetical protein ACSBR1_002545 [Camellia fascicularis]
MKSNEKQKKLASQICISDQSEEAFRSTSLGFLNEKLDRLASWVGTSVASAFFASVERYSCVNLRTSESDDENEEEAKDHPLKLTNLQVNSDSTNNRSSVDNLPV